MAAFGKRTSGAEVVEAFADQVKGRTFAITGPSTGGLGAQTALFLAAQQPAEILLLGRSEAKVTPVVEEIKKASPSTSVRFIALDLSDFSSIRSAAAQIAASTPKIDVLINNAGIMAIKDYTLTKDGIEAQFGANHVGHFLLTNLLVPQLIAAGKGARVVNLSSDGHTIGEFRGDDYNFNDGQDYDGWLAYGQSKTSNVLFAKALASRLAPKGILAFSLHPGVIWTNLATHVDESEWPRVTKMMEKRGIPVPDFTSPDTFKDLAQGTSTTLVAALDPALESQSGAYLMDCAPAKPLDYAADPVAAEKLWALSEKLVGETFKY
ncbi:short-chain dehydrogenase [Phlyctema vagabunda]|uniref:Short-chain dehydrogenase n=1 Tax=Phlyctema vagabunda TaxID=108571 RepID=A0ABR4PBA1_9HELO